MVHTFEHTEVYRRPGIFAGWPANHGLWARDGHIVVGFEIGEMDLSGGFHAINRKSPITPMMAETLDGGYTWDCWEPEGLLELRKDRGRIGRIELLKCLDECETQIDPVDFQNVMVKFRMMDLNVGASYVNYSDTYGRTWTGPYELDFREPCELTGRRGVSSRTSYLAVPGEPSRCLAFMSAAKASDSAEGQPFVCGTDDGGLHWWFQSWIDEPPAYGFGIMPSAVWIGESKLLCAVRWRERLGNRRYGRRGDEFKSGIVCYHSMDNGYSWKLVSIPVRGMEASGNPPDLVRMDDGRVVLVYGRRTSEISPDLMGNAIVAQSSLDDGVTWNKSYLIRSGGGCHDIGYTRSCMVRDNQIASVYYWNDHPLGERYIAATVWEP